MYPTPSANTIEIIEENSVLRPNAQANVQSTCPQLWARPWAVLLAAALMLGLLAASLSLRPETQTCAPGSVENLFTDCRTK